MRLNGRKKVCAYPQKSLRGSSRLRVNHEASMGIDAQGNERDMIYKHGHYQEVLLRPG